MIRFLLAFFVIAFLLQSCSPKGPAIVYLKNQNKVTGTARGLPENSYYGYTRLKVWDENGIKRKFRIAEIDSFMINDIIYESLTLKQRANIWGFPKRICMAKFIDGPMKLYVVTDMTLAISCAYYGWFYSVIDYYYIRKENDSLAHLIYKTKNQNYIFPTIIIQPLNSKEFIDYFSDAPEIQNRIKEKTYRRRDIYDLVLEYNEYVRYRKTNTR